MDQGTLSKRIRIRHYIILAVVTIAIILGIFIPTFWYIARKEQSYIVLREAKNLRIAFDIVATERYGLGGEFLDEERRSRVSKEFEEKIYELSGVEGTFEVTGWNEKKNKVYSFQYNSGKFVVTYYNDLAYDDTSWEVDYKLNFLDFK